MDKDLIFEIILISFCTLPIIYILWRWTLNDIRKSKNQCPRCGICLDGKEFEIVSVANGQYSGRIDHKMCLACAEITRKGPRWLWILVIGALVVFMVRIAIDELIIK